MMQRFTTTAIAHRPGHPRPAPASVLACLLVLGPLGSTTFADPLLFQATSPGNNVAVRADWLAAIGMSAGESLVDFESGFVDGQDIDGVTIGPGLSLFLDDTSSADRVGIECGAGSIGGSSPIGTCAAEHNERAYLVFDFSARPVDYVGFYDIDHTVVTDGGTIFFVGGATATFTLDLADTGAAAAEFFGIFRNDMARIERLQIDVGGDGQWGVDNIEYGRVEVPASSVPEPASLSLIGAGVFAALLRRRKRAAGGRTPPLGSTQGLESIRL
jgi:hypothetical protein